MPITIPSFRKNKFLSPWIDHLFPKLALLHRFLTDGQKVDRAVFFIELIGHSCCRLVLLSPTRSCLLLFVNVAPSVLLTFDAVGCLFLLLFFAVGCSFLLLFVAGYSCCRLLILVFPVVFCCSHPLVPDYCRFLLLFLLQVSYLSPLLAVGCSFVLLFDTVGSSFLLMFVAGYSWLQFADAGLFCCLLLFSPTCSCLLPFVAVGCSFQLLFDAGEAFGAAGIGKNVVYAFSYTILSIYIHSHYQVSAHQIG